MTAAGLVDSVVAFDSPAPTPVAADMVDQVDARLVTVDDPGNHETAPGSGFDGVVDLQIHTTDGVFRCSGSLLWTGQHILTAAHCITDASGNLRAYATYVTFEMPGGDVVVEADQFFVHPDYDGNVLGGGDIAIISLAGDAPVDAERYDIYRGADEVGQVGEKVGYGRTGQGNSGDTLSSGIKHQGLNRYDALADVFNNVFFSGIAAGTQLAFDFDNGSSANDAFGYFFGIHDTGLGINEVNSAPGDSGGPTFIGGEVAGVTSYGFGFLGATDVSIGTNSSFGEMSVDTRVSHYAGWIDGIIGTTELPPASPPEAPPEFTLADPGTGTAGAYNSWQVENATPGSVVYFAYGHGAGSTFVPTANLWLDIAQPKLLGTAVADANGTATLTRYVSSAAVGWSVTVQAVDSLDWDTSNVAYQSLASTFSTPRSEPLSAAASDPAEIAHLQATSVAAGQTPDSGSQARPQPAATLERAALPEVTLAAPHFLRDIAATEATNSDDSDTSSTTTPGGSDVAPRLAAVDTVFAMDDGLTE